jgi:hypothetical protein
MIRVDPSKMQTRRACNRCHQAKLKCVVEGNRKCQRCRRANSECTFSPPTRMQRQHTSPRSPPPPSFNSQEYQLNCWSDINLDWNLPVESSLLTTTGFDNSTQAGVEFPTSAQCSASIDYDNSSHIHDPASHLANYAELLMPSTLFGTSSSGTANETSDVGSGMFPGYVGAEGSRLNTASSYEAEGNEATAAGTLQRARTSIHRTWRFGQIRSRNFSFNSRSTCSLFHKSIQTVIIAAVVRTEFHVPASCMTPIIPLASANLSSTFLVACVPSFRHQSVPGLPKIGRQTT